MPQAGSDVRWVNISQKPVTRSKPCQVGKVPFGSEEEKFQKFVLDLTSKLGIFSR